MEFGLIPNLEQFQFNSQKNIQVINEARELQQVRPDREMEEVVAYEGIEETDEIKEFNSANKINISNYQEFELTNLNFGFNSGSKDFFVKVQRGEIENQYPTDEMMKLKEYLMNLNKAEQAS